MVLNFTHLHTHVWVTSAEAASIPQPDRVECNHLGGARRGRRLALQGPHTAPALTTPAALTTVVASAAVASTAALALALAVALALALGMHCGKAEQAGLKTKAIARREEVRLRAPGCT